jgi:hypothetical protein
MAAHRFVDGQLKHVRVSKQLGEKTTREKRPPKMIEDAAADTVAEACRACAKPENVLTFGDYIDKVFFPSVEQYKRASTMHGYRAIWKNHLKPRCAEVWLKDIRTYHIQGWIDCIAKSGPISRNLPAEDESLRERGFQGSETTGLLLGRKPREGCCSHS